jgi:hypothetical protein
MNNTSDEYLSGRLWYGIPVSIRFKVKHRICMVLHGVSMFIRVEKIIVFCDLYVLKIFLVLAPVYAIDTGYTPLRESHKIILY